MCKILLLSLVLCVLAPCITMAAVTITEVRRQTMDFSVPYTKAGQTLVARRELHNKETLADFIGMSVGAMTFSIAFLGEEIPGVKLKTYSEIGRAFEDLVNERIEAVICESPVAVYYVLSNERYKGKLKILGEPFTDEWYGVAVKRGNTEVLKAINRGLNGVLNTATYRRIEDKWLR